MPNRPAHSVGAYIHGVAPDEQRRLARLNDLINQSCLDAVAPRVGERVLDVGSGPGIFSRLIAERVGPTGAVVGVERSPEQVADAAIRLTAADAGPARAPIEHRLGDAAEPPLEPAEFGSFDLAHCRFLLEHVTDPPAVVSAMANAVRPGGRVFLADDDHDLLRLWPSVASFERLWSAYIEAYRAIGADPYIGRKLVTLLHGAGCSPLRSGVIDFGACAGEARFGPLVENLIGIVLSARETIARLGLICEEEFERAMADLRAWAMLPDASLWYVVLFAEGIRRER